MIQNAYVFTQILITSVKITRYSHFQDGSSLSDTSPSNTYTLALIFSLYVLPPSLCSFLCVLREVNFSCTRAHPYGTPTILSSFSFDDFDAGAPNNGKCTSLVCIPHWLVLMANYLGTGSCSGSGGADGWLEPLLFILSPSLHSPSLCRLCQHRWPAVAGMAGFRNCVNAAASNDLTNWISPSSQQIAFSRGAVGFVAINNADEEWTADLNTGLPGGSYCNVIEGPQSGGACAGAS